MKPLKIAIIGIIVLLAMNAQAWNLNQKTVLSDPLRLGMEAYLRGYKTDGVGGDPYALFIYGTNPALSTGAEDYWSAGGVLTLPTADANVTIVSDDDQDDGSPVGTGARTVALTLMTSGYDITSLTMTLDGNATVTSALKYLRVLGASVATAGSTGANEGIITIAIGGTQAVILAGENKSNSASYTIPDEYTGYITELHASSNAAVATTVKILIKAYGGLSVTWFQWQGYLSEGKNLISTYLPGLPEKTDIRVTGLVGTGTPAGTASYKLILMPASWRE